MCTIISGITAVIIICKNIPFFRHIKLRTLIDIYEENRTIQTDAELVIGCCEYGIARDCLCTGMVPLLFTGNSSPVLP